MVNKSVFKSPSKYRNLPAATKVNEAGGKAIAYSDKHALAQLACAGTFNGVFYASADDTLASVKDLVNKLSGDPKFIAQVALYARNKGFMKDTPAFLVSSLAALDKELFRKVFPKVIDNGKMLRNAVQMARSGELGKVYNLSAGTWRNALNTWFATKSSEAIFRASVGNDPKLEDIIKMARPKPDSPEKEALYAYLLGKDKHVDNLPTVVKNYEFYKKNKTGEVPNVDFRLLDSLGLGKAEWTQIALNAGWQMLRMNLNTFNRHGVYADKDVVKALAEKLRNRDAIVKARAFPYQLLTAHNNVDIDLPYELKEALQDAMEIATENTPVFDGDLYICVDTSGSMSGTVMGKGAAPSKTRYVDVAALFASCVLRKNPGAKIVPFDTSVYNCNLNPRDSVMTNATILSRFGGGGTDCGMAMDYVRRAAPKGASVIFVSDNESWVDRAGRGYWGSNSTTLMSAWQAHKAGSEKARLVCIDIAPYITSQSQARPDILQVGGFSDNVFEVVNNFLKFGAEDDHWVKEIEAVEV